MKIHLNIEDRVKTLNDAREAAGVWHERCKASGSRTHLAKYDIILSGESGRQMNSGRYGPAPCGSTEAATWDQWGIYLAVIFEADPTAKTDYYADAEDFHRQTGGRFDREPNGGPFDAERVLSRESPDYKITAHRWTPDFENNRPLSGYFTLRCEGHSVKKNKRAECHAVWVRASQAKCECDMGNCPRHQPTRYARYDSRHVTELEGGEC